MGKRTVLIAFVTGVLVFGINPPAPKPLEAINAYAERPKMVVIPHGKTPHSARLLAKYVLRNSTWRNGKQWQCLDNLWYEESRWIYTADNPYTSAYGIAQVLNTPKHFTPRKQIERGIKYIKARYTNPCNAWQHFQIKHWY